MAAVTICPWPDGKRCKIQSGGLNIHQSVNFSDFVNFFLTTNDERGRRSN